MNYKYITAAVVAVVITAAVLYVFYPRTTEKMSNYDLVKFWPNRQIIAESGATKAVGPGGNDFDGDWSIGRDPQPEAARLGFQTR